MHPKSKENKCPQIMCNLVMKQKAKEILIHATPIYQYHIPLNMVIYGQNLMQPYYPNKESPFLGYFATPNTLPQEILNSNSEAHPPL